MNAQRNPLLEKVSGYMDISSAFGRLEKRGQLSTLVSLIREIKDAEEQELTSLNQRTEIPLYNSGIFKENIKVLVQLVSNILI